MTEDEARQLAYLAGPMAGVHNYNLEAFAEAAEELRRGGFDVINPHEQPWQLNAPDGLTGDQERAWYLRHDFAALLECDVIVGLPGWEQSTGASAEVLVAMTVGMPVYEFVPYGNGSLVLAVASNPQPNIWAVVDHCQLVRP